MKPSVHSKLIVACLCADWCHICNDYRATFEVLHQEFGDRAQFVWVDIEDNEAVVGDLDIDNFPTLFLAAEDRVRFFGAVVPHQQTASQLIGRALDDQLGTIADPAMSDLLIRLRHHLNKETDD